MNTMGILHERTERVRKYKRVCKNHKVSNSNQLWEMILNMCLLLEQEKLLI